MKYNDEDRIEIGRQIYENELTRYEAARMYGVSAETARSYMREYRDAHNLPPKSAHTHPAKPCGKTPECWDDYKDMSKEELLYELAKSKIEISRLKKGYMVKGSGSNKTYLVLDSRTTK